MTDEIRNRNAKELKSAWERHLKSQETKGYIYACTKCDNAFWSQEKQFTETCDRCGGTLEEITWHKGAKQC